MRCQGVRSTRAAASAGCAPHSIQSVTPACKRTSIVAMQCNAMHQRPHLANRVAQCPTAHMARRAGLRDLAHPTVDGVLPANSGVRVGAAAAHGCDKRMGKWHRHILSTRVARKQRNQGNNSKSGRLHCGKGSRVAAKRRVHRYVSHCCDASNDVTATDKHTTALDDLNNCQTALLFRAKPLVKNAHHLTHTHHVHPDPGSLGHQAQWQLSEKRSSWSSS